MRSLLKWLGIILGGLLAFVVVALAVAYLLSEQRFNRTFEVPVEDLAFETNEQTIDHGEHLAVIRGCTDCHGDDLGGKVMIDDPMIGTIAAANLTTGNGGAASSYSDAELARAIRHGVDHQDGGLLIMPSQEYFILSDGDVSALVAYLRSLPPVNRELAEPQVALMARVLFMTGQLPPLAAEVIDHQEPHPEAPSPAVSVEYGGYLATSCIGCHGSDYAGGTVPGSAPDAPKAANLTPAGDLADWTEDQFIETLRTGVTPAGHELDPAEMPWTATAEMSELELKALWAFLQSLPPLETN